VLIRAEAPSNVLDAIAEAVAARMEAEGQMQEREASALQPVHNVKPYKRVRGIHQIERFFRAAAGLEIDKEDIGRYYVESCTCAYLYHH
jgi:hypothetical protein